MGAGDPARVAAPHGVRDVAGSTRHAERHAERPALPPALSPALPFERAIEGLPLILFGVDADGRYAWLANVHPPWSEEMLLGRTDVELLGPEQGGPIMEAKRRVLATGRPERIEFDTTVKRYTRFYGWSSEGHQWRLLS